MDLQSRRPSLHTSDRDTEGEKRERKCRKIESVRGEKRGEEREGGKGKKMKMRPMCFMG